ncbi:vitamin K epoxide reductase family protein [Coleofasciculus sp. FACHB-1120]|uniref:vitamin K epoxide reductase family protein n=1 Tax=Coleofasciculus sp. FACHB-1120 TaxID=2692783 RepID=UPI00168922FA|nr:vitamin K epoxide reductase family protein [Coleofasciculus sp. FACHB-1120]MBD2740958.1 vitamin K epoxide reductase family protein [Coleofasciculus sp. FACHB-1120]
MSRRRSTPWIHRWSRLLIAAIAILGALVTGYLTVVKLTGGSAACPTSGCDQVLSSPYASIFGFPLTLFGLLAYLSMVAFALAPMAVNPVENKDLHSQLDHWTWLLLFAGGTAMTVFSGYLMYLLAFEIKAACLYCLASAFFSLSLLVLTLIGRAWEDWGQLFFTGIIVGMVALVSTLGVYATVKSPVASGDGSAGSQTFPITTVSSSAEVALAKHLEAVGAKMYGAFWCSHCHDQKQLFGKEAFSQINYIECADPKAPQQQAEICQKAGIQSYPSWEVNGKLVEPGVKSLEKLADLSSYTGPRNFQNSLPGL